jgi:hypothetical protein
MSTGDLAKIEAPKTVQKAENRVATEACKGGSLLEIGSTLCDKPLI